MSDSIVEEKPAEAEAEHIIFPSIKRRVFDVLHDDERHEVWIGIRLRTTVKAKMSEDGPIEDIEVPIDPIGILTSLDASKQEVMLCLNQDGQKLIQERASRQALQKHGVLGRINRGLTDLFGKKNH